MLREYVEKQRQNERAGFRNRHPEVVETDFDAINRRNQVLTNVPAFQRSSFEEGRSDGRYDYLKSRDNVSKNITSDLGKFEIDPKWLEPEDVWEKSKTDPELRKQLYLRRQMKSQNFGLMSGNSSRNRQPTVRPLAKLPIVSIPVDSSKAQYDYESKTLLADRDPNWRPVLQKPLYKREQHVFLPQGTERLLQEMSTEPIKQRTLNILQPEKPQQVPNLKSGYPVDFNPELLRFKPETTQYEKFLQNPEYYEFLKTKVDLDLKPPPSSSFRGLRDLEQRREFQDVGAFTDIDRKPLQPRMDIGQQQKQVFWKDNNQPIQIDNKPIQTTARDIITQNERYYSDYPEIEVDQQSTFYPSHRGSLVQQPVEFRDNNQPLELDSRYDNYNFREVIHDNPITFRDHSRLGFDANHDQNIPRKRDQIYRESERDYLDRDDEEWTNEYEKNFIPRSRTVARDESRSIQNQPPLQLNTEKKVFKTLRGLKSNPVSFNDFSRENLSMDGKMTTTERTRLKQNPVEFKSQPSVEIEVNDLPRPLSLEKRFHSPRDVIQAEKVSISGREFKTVPIQKLKQNDVQFGEELKNADISGLESSITRGSINEKIRQHDIRYESPVKVEVQMEDRMSRHRTTNIQSRSPRKTEPLQNIDMDVQHLDSTKYTIIPDNQPRRNPPRPEYEIDIPTAKEIASSRFKLRGAVQNSPRSRPMTPIEPPEISIPGLRAPVPTRRVTTPRSRFFQRSTPNKQVEEIERIKKYLNLPNPF
jgi:hypothetical protein